MFARFTYLFSLTLTLLASTAQGQVLDWWSDIYGKNAANSSAAFLTLPSSAGHLARGLVSSPGTMGSADLPFFPSNSARVYHHHFTISHLQWLMGLRKQSAAAMFPLLHVGTFGVYFRFLSSGEFDYARDIDQRVSDPRYAEYVVGASFAREFLNHRLSVGANVNYVESRLDIDAGRAFSAGADLYARPFDLFSGRIYLLNVGTPISYSRIHSDPLPIQTGASINIHPFGDDPDHTPLFDLDVGAGVQKTADEPLVFGVSTGLRTGSSLFWRAGYEHNTGTQRDFSGFSAGFGFKAGNYGLDAAWKMQSQEFGGVWAADIYMHLDELKERSADEYYRIALYHFEKGRSRLARTNAYKALRVEANHWLTHTLLSKMRSEELRSANIEIGLIYSGNINARFIPFPPSPDALGGLSRIGALVNRLASSYKTAFTLDAGNIVNSSTHDQRVQLADDFYNHMGYDIVSLGQGELPFLNKLFTDRRLASQVVISNLSSSLPSNITDYALVQRGGYNIFAMNVIGESMIADPSDSITVSNTITALHRLIHRPSAKNSHLRVVTIHDSWENIQAIAHAVPGIDVIVCGSLNQRFEAPMRVGTATIVSPGSDGRFVGTLSVRFNQNKEAVSFENRLYPVVQSIEPDSVLEERTNLVSAKIQLEKAGIDIQSRESVRGIIPFVSDRFGPPQVHLKAMQRRAELPLNRNDSHQHQPRISFESGKVLYLTSKPEDKTTGLEVLELSTFRSRSITGSRSVTEAIFSNDGKWIFFVAADSGSPLSSIYKTPSGTKESVIPVVAIDTSAQHSITFSPDGEQLLFISTEKNRKQIYITDPDGVSPLPLSDINANHYLPSFSPDGRYIAYISDRFGIGGRKDLWVYDRKSSSHQRITNNLNVREYCWTDDSKRMVFSSGVTMYDLNIVDIEQNRFRKLNETTGVKTWEETTPRFLFYDHRPRILYNRILEDGSVTVHWFDLISGRDERIVTSEGNDWLE